ncbi:DUF2075 domain-containing protein [Aedoeadaptatus coli]|uniref:DUF2075 domain-containing protein n=1 Tax=Aedoeadaptatus coli TaxID=2058292 RepID=UPI000D559827|nr:DUF2075 domain-containing protein [Peptoniphilus coli]
MGRLNAYYESTISEFLKRSQEAILGTIMGNDISAETRNLQRNTWKDEIAILKRELKDFDESNGRILFEYTIPRMGKRVDAIVLYRNIVFVLEFKCGSEHYYRADYDQVYDYALDLKNFHEESRHRFIVPILIATEAPHVPNEIEFKDQVMWPLKCNDSELGALIRSVAKGYPQEPFSYDAWINSPYRPTPTIVEAAQALYINHDVKEITRNDAGAKNITVTTDAVNKIIDKSKVEARKSICFVTGVPGAGKTLVGLNLSTQRANAKKDEHAVFLSGNYPLVKVLQEALVENKVNQMKSRGLKATKDDERRAVKSFIQIIHKYRDSFVNNDHVPPEHVVIYDEAQRSWNAEQIEKFMKNRKGINDFQHSEPEFLISTMDRHSDWAVVVCLIGGGQEIYTGEGGLPEWFHALRHRFKDWDIYISDHLKEEYVMDSTWEEMIGDLDTITVEDLHLSVSLRSFRTPDLADFVKAMLDIDCEQAKKSYAKIREKYPICITRDLDRAKTWVREKARGTQRYGLLATSGALRLKPEGIFVKNKINEANWFLKGKDDVRSCYGLEDVATEFAVQGLELDYTIVAWDADLRMSHGRWEYKRFKGTVWNNINKREDQIYLKNAYRVLLTRARQGMVLFIPQGCDEDETRQSIFYDETYNYLTSLGIEEI